MSFLGRVKTVKKRMGRAVEQQKKKQTWLVNVLVVVAVGLYILFMLYLFRFRITDMINTFFFADYDLKQMTTEEKLADFEEFYNTILEATPYLNEVKELYGIDFVERKSYYEQEIKNTKNNLEFYGVMKAIAGDLASFHTDVCFPWYDNLTGLSCYDSEEILAQIGIKAKLEAWMQDIGEEIEEYEDVKYVAICYVDGEYLVWQGGTDKDYQYLAHHTLVSVNGISADKFCVESLGLYDLSYDSSLDKPYRQEMLFNDSVGELVTVIWKDEKGTEVEEKWYYDVGAEVAHAYKWLYQEEQPTESSSSDEAKSFYAYRDDINQLEYVIIDNFQDERAGQEIYEYLSNTVYDKIVIDLRSNYGGFPKYASEYIYPALYSKDLVHTFQCMVPDKDVNNAQTKDWIVWLTYPHTKDEENYYFTVSRKYKGEQEKDKDVYYLVGVDTGSAADTYINFVKENQLGTVVGTNTGGEGLGLSFICDSLSNSSLVYVHYASKPVTPENINFSGGTEPDVYICRSREDFELREAYRKQGIEENYETQLEYDTVLKWVIEQRD